jgi:hypothetical protein
MSSTSQGALRFTLLMRPDIEHGGLKALPA